MVVSGQEENHESSSLSVMEWEVPDRGHHVETSPQAGLNGGAHGLQLNHRSTRAFVVTSKTKLA